MADQRVRVRIQADASQADREIKKTGRGFQRFGKILSTTLKAGFVAATAAATAFIAVMVKAVKATNEQELAVVKLDTALKPLGSTAGEVSKRLQEQASALQKVTTAGDETIIAGQALLASFTKNEEEIRGATVAALDLAAATGQDLNSAFLLLGKAAAGETGTLSRYGIVLEEGLEGSEKFAAALAAITKQFGGQAQAAAQTFGGRIKQLSNAYGDVLEQIGANITEQQRFNDAVSEGTQFLETYGQDIADITGKIIDLTVATAKLAASTFGAIVDQGAKVVEFFEDWNGKIEETEIRQAALERTANRLGVTTGELATQVDQAAIRTAQFNAANRRSLDTIKEKIVATQSDTAATAENTASTEDNVDATEKQNEATEIGGDLFEDLTEALKTSSREQDTLRINTERATAALLVQNEVVAVNAGIGGGGVPFGRVRIPGQHGSRLIRPRGFGNGSNLTGTFTTIRPSVVTPDGKQVYI